MNNQQKGNWCWAASSQAVLKYYGVNKSQEAIVIAAKGKDNYNKNPNMTGTTSDIKNVLNNLLNETSCFVDYTNTSESSKISYKAVKSKIKNDRPVILTGYYTIGDETSEHSMLCYGYDSSDKDNLKLLVFSSTKDNVDEVTLTCSSESDTTYNMKVKKGIKTEENGTFEVAGITYASKEIRKK